jgi:hypothetical protein
MSLNPLTGPAQTVTSVLGVIDTEQRNPLGMIATDGAGGEYIYLKGVTGTVAGTWVTYDELAVTALLTHDAVGPVAVATGITVGSTYGWYCIKSPEGGFPCGAAATVVADLPAYIDGSDGLVDDDVVSGDLVAGAFIRSTTSSALATCQFNRPFVTNTLS